MSFRDAKRLESTIDAVFAEAKDGELSVENQARLAQLVTVLASGYIEVKCRQVFTEYTTKRANPNVMRYVSAKLKRFRNPNMHKVVELARAFDSDAADELVRFAKGRIEDSVNSVVDNRHAIAHGRYAQVSLGRVTQYYGDVRELVRKLRQLFS